MNRYRISSETTGQTFLKLEGDISLVVELCPLKNGSSRLTNIVAGSHLCMIFMIITSMNAISHTVR